MALITPGLWLKLNFAALDGPDHLVLCVCKTAERAAAALVLREVPAGVRLQEPGGRRGASPPSLLKLGTSETEGHQSLDGMASRSASKGISLWTEWQQERNLHCIRQCGTKEMMQPFLIYLHVISLVGRPERSEFVPSHTERHQSLYRVTAERQRLSSSPPLVPTGAFPCASACHSAQRLMPLAALVLQAGSQISTLKATIAGLKRENNQVPPPLQISRRYCIHPLVNVLTEHV